jgi:prepilin-type processing-associated H-X9-DG protein
VIVPQTSGMAQSVAPIQAPVKKSSGTPWIVVLSIVCVVLLMCGGVLVALLLPAVNAAREAGRRASCLNKMHQLGLAMANYQSTYGHYPPASGGTKGHPVSWRVALLPFMEYDYLYKQYHQDEPWNSPNNLAIAKQALKEYQCPSDTQDGAGETSYVMITGKNTAGGTPGSPGARLMQFTNGSSQTIMIVEVHGLKIPWTEPRDITLDELIQRVTASGGHIGHVSGFNVTMADGSVRNIPAQINPGDLRIMATVNGGKPVETDEE